MYNIECIHHLKYFRYFTLHPLDIPDYYDQQQGKAIFYLCRSVSKNVNIADKMSDKLSMSLLLYCIVLVQLVCHAPRTGLNIYEIYQVITLFMKYSIFHDPFLTLLFLQFTLSVCPLLTSRQPFLTLLILSFTLSVCPLLSSPQLLYQL